MSSSSTPTKRTVLITGCSDGSLGAGLALAFHKAGLHVYATARNPAKLTAVRAAGIETLPLDVCDAASIAACVAQVPALDVLVNNAGATYLMPVSDLSLAKARALFDLNVWSYLAVTQAFLPLLLRSSRGAMVLNQTSGASVSALPLQATYNASKAAMASFSETMRLELAPFGVQVVELKTTIVKSNMVGDKKKPSAPSGGDSQQAGPKLPEGSIWAPAREEVESRLRTDHFAGHGWETHVWAEGVVKTVLKKNPPYVVYGGEGWWSAKLAPMLPHGSLDGFLKKFVGFDKIEEIIRKHRAGK